MGYKLWEACGEPDPKLAKARGDPSLADRTEAAFTKLASECPEKEVLHRDSDGYTVLMEMVRNYDWPEGANEVEVGGFAGLDKMDASSWRLGLMIPSAPESRRRCSRRLAVHSPKTPNKLTELPRRLQHLHYHVVDGVRRAAPAAAIMRESIAGRRLMTVSAVHHLYAVKRECALTQSSTVALL